MANAVVQLPESGRLCEVMKFKP